MNAMHFNGPCPYLTCLKTEPHSHPVCPACGAVRYGNLQCATCLAHLPERRAEMAETLETLNRAAAAVEPIR